MRVTVDDISNDHGRFRQVTRIDFPDLAGFILRQLAGRSAVNYFFWMICIITLLAALYIRISIAGDFPLTQIIFHSFSGAVVILLISIPLHELMHVIPYYLGGARDIRAGMDLRQYLFYVTAHRFVTSPVLFVIVALTPFVLITAACIILILFLPWNWKWSFSLFLFLHTTMCAGDFAMLNFYWMNRDKRILTWDDAEEKVAYFYEEAESEERGAGSGRRRGGSSE